MKRIIILLCIYLFLSCKKETTQRNPYLPETRFSFTVNTNLALYNGLKTPLNPVVINNEGVGLRGIILINTGSGYLAWERACPHLALTSCSTMEIINGLYVKCPCDEVTYSLVNGNPTSGNTSVGLLFYNVTNNGNILTISN